MSTGVIKIDAHARLPREAGGKASGLQFIARAGLRVPPAWVVLPGASPESLAEEVRATGAEFLAVRSSAQGEDGDRASYAGIHETLLAVRIEDLPDAIHRVSMSPLSEKACAYREAMGLPPASGPCAVVLQVMINSEFAGIAFGAEAGGSDQIVIEAVEGLGESAVNGQVHPEVHNVMQVDGRWRTQKRKQRFQSVLTTVQSGQLTQLSPATAGQPGFVVTPGCATEIASGVSRLQTRAGKLLDVEWAFADDRLWFLQARPQTRQLTGKIPPGQTWTRVNVREILPDLPSAFTRCSVGPALDQAEREVLQAYGIRTDPSVPVFTFICGRPVFNEFIFRTADMLGVSRERMQLEFGGSLKMEKGYSVQPADIKVAMRHPVILLRAVFISLTAGKAARRFIESVRKVLCDMAALDAKALEGREVVKFIREVYDFFPYRLSFHAVRVAAAVSNAQDQLLASLRDHPSPLSLMAHLVAGGKPSVSTQQIDDLIELADCFRSWPGAVGFINPVLPYHAEKKYWEEHLPANLWTKVQEWLDLYGHRGPFESDLEWPRFADDLRVLARTLSPFLLDDGTAIRAARDSRKRREAESLNAWREIRLRKGRLRAKFIKNQVRRLRDLTSLREELRSEAVAAMLPVRRIVLDLGRKLKEQGRLANHEDVWHLSLDQLERAFDQPGYPVGVAVARELAEKVALRRIHVPNRFTSEEVPGIVSRSIPTESSVSVLHGNGVSPGIVEGKVCVLRTAAEGNRFPSGGIIVAPATDPGWTPLFARAVGVIAELGGVLSHAGIVAREYGIPCVANIDGVTGILNDGDTVRIDGSTGEVILLSRAES